MGSFVTLLGQIYQNLMHQNPFISQFFFRDLMSFTLQISEYTDSTDADALRENLVSLLKSKGFNENDIKSVHYVSDEGPNIVNSLAEYENLRCACHVVNLIALHCLIPYKDSYLLGRLSLDLATTQKLKEIDSLLDSMNEIIRTVR